jgi:membrane-associated protein
MLFGMDIAEFIRAVGVLGIAAVIFAETGLLIGFLLPGDTLLFAAGFLASQDALGVSIHALTGLLFIAAVFGDSVGYAIGRRAGPYILKKPDSLVFNQDYIKKAEAFYKRFGAITIIVARFVPIVRTFAPVLAGVGKMNYRTFLIYNLVGGLLWAVGLTYLGYYAGAFFEARGIAIDQFIYPVIALAMFITLISPLVHILQNPKSRAKLLARFRK